KKMRVTCGCGHKALITKSNRISLDYVELYCTCPECGHRFVWSAGFKHSINAAPEKISLIKEMAKTLSALEKRDLVHLLSESAQ
ncbi:TPA: ogr/Delta-like zinc finger family protein, partial [Vibrio harveyi]